MLCVTTPGRCRLDAEPSPIIEAGKRVVVPDDTGLELINKAWREQRAEIVWSALGSYIRPYHGHDLNGKRVMIYRGCGIGDLLIAGGIGKVLKDRFPDASIDLWFTNRRSGLWEGDDDPPLRSRLLPVPFSEFKEYDYHLLFEAMVECDLEDDQPDIWAAHLNLAGIDWDCDPRPYVVIRPEARDKARRIVGQLTRGRPFILYQLQATSPIRSVAPWKNREILEAIRARFPDVPVVSPRYGEDGQILAGEGLVEYYCDDDIQVSFGILEKASAIVCPDSCFGHASSVLDTPAVSLWGSFLPEDRVGRYGNHRPVVGTGDCSPCRRHEGRNRNVAQMDSQFHYRGCPANQSFCNVLSQIEPEQIVEKLTEVLV